MDINKALSDGYSKEDVLSELGKRTKMNYKQALSDGYSIDDVISEMNRRDSGSGSKESTPKPIPLLDVAKGYVTNYPKSVASNLKGMWNMLTDLPNSIGAVGDVIEGTTRGALVDNYKPATPFEQSQKSTSDAFIQAMKDRYGGWENIKRTTRDDPFGATMDAASLFTMGGLPQVGRAIEPINMAKNIAGATTKLVPKGLPMRWYESALKPGAPTKTFTREQQLEALQAGLDHGIMGSGRGSQKIDDIVAQVQNDIDAMITSGNPQGRRVDKARVLQALDRSYDFFSDVPGSEGYIAEINAMKDSFNKQHGRYIPIEQAQDIKKKIGVLVRKEYQKMSTATIEVKKDLAFGLKEEIADIFPEITNKNHLESMMIRLEPIIEKAAARLRKRDLGGIGTPITGGAVGASTGSWKAGLAAGVTKAVLEHPSVKAYIAILLNKARKGGLGPGFVEERLAAYWASKMAEQGQEE